jgi:hypothetical protein
MTQNPITKKEIIRYWEKRRLCYNLLLILPAIFGFLAGSVISAAVGDEETIGSIGIGALFLVSCVLANICFSIVYAFEFFFHSDNTCSVWAKSGRDTIFVCGCIFAILLALLGGRNIAFLKYAGF